MLCPIGDLFGMSNVILPAGARAWHEPQLLTKRVLPLTRSSLSRPHAEMATDPAARRAMAKVVFPGRSKAARNLAITAGAARRADPARRRSRRPPRPPR